MPFVTEEVYHLLREHSDDLCVKQFGAIAPADAGILATGELLKQVISALRDARNKNQLKPKDPVQLHIQTATPESYASITGILSKQVNAAGISFTQQPVANAIVVAIEKDKFFIETNRQIDTAALKEELLKDLEYQKRFLDSVQKKLGNERFIQNAKPEVVAIEQKKRADAEARIKTIEESLANL